MRRSRWTISAGITLLVLVVACDAEITLSPQSPGALVPGEGENIATVHPAHIGATNPGFGTGSCPSPGWGWHFVMQGSPSENYFVELAATFSRDGDQVTLIAEEFEPNDQHGYIYTDGPGWRLDGAEAIVVGGNTRFNLSHVCTGPDATTTTSAETTTTLQTTTTTIEPTTTLSPGGLTTTTEGDVTTTDPGDATTTTQGGEVTTTEAGATTTTAAAVTTTTSDEAASTTSAGETTTTVEVGAGTLEPGQVTTTIGDTETTTDDDVSEESEGTLPRTGAGGMTTGGLAGMLVAAGVVLLLLTRKRSGAE